MALVRTAIADKLEADPSFHLKIHRNQLIQIKSVHPHVNEEGKKRLADFAIECSDPDFVLIMENLGLKKVLNLLAVCNPTSTLDLNMSIGVSKNQIGCADPFSACYVKCNGNGRRKNQPKYIPYPQEDYKEMDNNTNVPVLPQPTSAPEIKQESQPPRAEISKRKGRPARPPRTIKEEIIKPIEVTPHPLSLKSFFKQIQIDSQLPSADEQNNNNIMNVDNMDNTENIVVEQVGTDIDPLESPSQIGSALSAQGVMENPASNSPNEAHNHLIEESTNVSAPDPGNNDASLADQTTKETRPENQPEISADGTKKDNNTPQEVAAMAYSIEKVLMDQIAMPELNLATDAELTQYSTEATQIDDKNNATNDSLMNQEEMAEIFKEIFPEYYTEANENANDEFNEINGMLFNTEDNFTTNVPMETDKPVTENLVPDVNTDPTPQLEESIEMRPNIEEASSEVPPRVDVNTNMEEAREKEVEVAPVAESTSVLHDVPQLPEEQSLQLPVQSTEGPRNMVNEIEKEIQVAEPELMQTEVPATDKMEDIVTDNNAEEHRTEKLSEITAADEHVKPVEPTQVVPTEEVQITAENTESEVKLHNSESAESAVNAQQVESSMNISQTTEENQAEVLGTIEVSVPSNETSLTGVTENISPEVMMQKASNENDVNSNVAVTNTDSVQEENNERTTVPVESDPIQQTEQKELEQTITTSNQGNSGKELEHAVQECDSDTVEKSPVTVNQQTDADQVPANGENSDRAILVAEEKGLDLNEIMYDGEIVIDSDEDEDRPKDAPFIDFFCEEILANDEENNNNQINVYNNNNEDHNMVDEGPQATRKRKRGFSLESVVFRSVRPKVEHVAIKQEPGTTPAKENNGKDSQTSPIIRAIFGQKSRKSKAVNNNATNNNNNDNSRGVTRRVTRSTGLASPIEIPAQKGKTKNNNNRRASSHNETTIKKENQADDSPRILIYNERTRRGLPKKETKPKRETKVIRAAPRKISAEEKSSKNSENSSADSDEDSVEYHVDKLSEDEYFVEEIVDKKVEKGKAQYLIKWLGWPHSDNTWTPEEDISPDIIEVYENSPKERKPGDKNVLVYNLFWKYAFRRHVRYVKEHPEDPNYENCKDVDVSDGLLDKFSMCNCYRELDSGSIYFHKQVARMKREENDDEDKATTETIWMAFCYRLINRLATFEGFGRIPTSQQWPQFKKYLSRLRESGDSIFTSKHNVIGFENYFGVMDNLTAKIDTLHGKFERRKASLQQCLEYAQTVPFIGPFFAQQICNDLVEEGIINGSNSWVCLGPGAKAGLRNIYPGIKGSELLDKAKQLQKNQRKAFVSLGLEFPYYDGRDLSLIDIEHVLCEFQKYLRMLGKTSSKKQYRRSTDRKENNRKNRARKMRQ